ncbi:uncharacterized protein LOC127864095 [Dreissena polymorpha]|uniref:uncharacterized protein LOC127864095 n=1 Tax=Dreissena polymorpha TaxID=45954 RepID=UPI0022654B2C|nr:uncharacterized protein LOC127864095 [Dreissena polymorpha]
MTIEDFIVSRVHISGRGNRRQTAKRLNRQHFNLNLNDTQPLGRKVAHSAIYVSEERDIIYREDVELDGTTSTLTIMYQTLKQYNNLLYRDATALPQNIAVQIVNVVFPPGDTDYSFVTYNLNQGVLDWAVLYSFVSFLQTYISPVPYDHATFVTGFDLRYYGAAINGDAFLRSMCIQWVFDYGYHSSIAAFNADAIETMAQLLGYG